MRIDTDEILVDIGAKSEGVIDNREPTAATPRARAAGDRRRGPRLRHPAESNTATWFVAATSWSRRQAAREKEQPTRARSSTPSQRAEQGRPDRRHGACAARPSSQTVDFCDVRRTSSRATRCRNAEEVEP